MTYIFTKKYLEMISDANWLQNFDFSHFRHIETILFSNTSPDQLLGWKNCTQNYLFTKLVDIVAQGNTYACFCNNTPFCNMIFKYEFICDCFYISICMREFDPKISISQLLIFLAHPNYLSLQTHFPMHLWHSLQIHYHLVVKFGNCYVTNQLTLCYKQSFDIIWYIISWIWNVNNQLTLEYEQLPFKSVTNKQTFWKCKQSYNFEK